MKNGALLLMRVLAVACLLVVCLRPAEAYIKAPPQTLGSMCHIPDHICVLRVEKVNADNGVILFKHVEQLKGTHDGAVVKHVIRPNVTGAKVILDWAAEGKTAVMFYFTGGNDRGHVYIDGYWYWVGGKSSKPGKEGKGVRPDLWWFAVRGEPTLLTLYCGTADNLRDAVAKILRGDEVMVPAMVGDNRELEQGRGTVRQMRAGLRIGPDPSRHLVEVFAPIGGKAVEKNPGDQTGGKKPEPGGKKPDGKKADDRKPDSVGTVKALSGDGKSFTLQPAPTEKNKKPAALDIQITEGTKIIAGKEPGKLAVGQTVGVWLGKGSANVAVEIQIGKPPERPEKKPGPDDKGKKPALDAGAKPIGELVG